MAEDVSCLDLLLLASMEGEIGILLEMDCRWNEEA